MSNDSRSHSPHDEARLRQAIDSAEDFAIFTMDPEGRIETWNVGAANIFGWTEEEIVGQDTAVVFTPEDRARGVHKQEQAQAARDGRAADERWHVRRDGSRFYASGVMRPLYGPGRVVTGFAKIARDLTERQRAEDRLKEAGDVLEARVAQRTGELAEANASLRDRIQEREVAERAREAMLRELVNGLEAERERVSRELHDHLGQRMSAITLKLAMLRRNTELPAEVRADLERLEALARETDSDLDFLVWELRPRALDELGLLAALRDFVEEWSAHFGIRASFRAEPAAFRLDPDLETVLYRVAQEALNNAAKHARASLVQVALVHGEGVARLTVQDDGVGFTPRGGSGDARRQRVELASMRERAALVGATMTVQTAPGKGTRIEVSVPADALGAP